MRTLRLVCVRCDNDLDVLVGTCNGATVAKVLPCPVCADMNIKQLLEIDQLKEENERLLELAKILRREVPAGYMLCYQCARRPPTGAACGGCTAANGWTGFRKKGDQHE